MDYLTCTFARIRAIIAHSPVPEDPLHCESTVQWLLKLRPEASDALCIAALGHDVERAVQSRRIRKTAFTDFDAFKAAHARNSAEILAEIMDDCRVPERVAQEAQRLVSLHEFGGDPDADLLKDADSISFFHINLSYYVARNEREEIIRRCLWGFRRLSPHARDIVRALTYDDPSLQLLMREVVEIAGQWALPLPLDLH
jgi:hypothetical protein